MKDIESREDIIALINQFYNKVQQNELIGNIFTDIAQVNWDHHLPRMYDFWETILFGKEAFKGNPMLKHIQLSKLTAMEQIHFNEWLLLWNKTIDENFNGETADLAKFRAKSIADLMLYKITNLT